MLIRIAPAERRLFKAPSGSLGPAFRAGLLLTALFTLASSCKLVTPDSFLDPTPDSNELLKTMNVRNNGELWSGVVAGDLPAGVTGVDVKFDDGPWKKAEINGNRWRVFIPTGAEAAAGRQRWQVGSRHRLQARMAAPNGNYRNPVSINFFRQLNKDTNADGYADNIVGAPLYNSNQGRVYIFTGTLGGIASQVATAANAVLTGEASNNYFGGSVALGDVNGDGYSDAIVGAYRYNTYQGRVYIFYGTTTGIASQSATTAGVTLTGEGSNNGFGVSISLGDINGDGYTDVIVGANRINTNQGAGYIFHGASAGIASQGAATANTIFSGIAAADELGYSLALGDVNADGCADVVIAAYRDNNTYQGRAYIFQGSLSGIASQSTATANTTLTGEAALDKFGWSVAIGDVNADSYADIAVGAPGFNGGTNQGRAYLFHGSPTGIASQGAAAANTILTAEGSSNELGSAVSLSDINGDGFSDLLIGAVRYNNNYQGRAYVFQGGASGIASQGAAAANTILTGQGAGDQFGGAVALSDLNGDGYTDILVGANQANGTGQSYIFKGGSFGVSSQSAGTANGILTGESSGNQYGSSVGSLAPALRPSPANLNHPSPPSPFMGRGWGCGQDALPARREEDIA